MSRPRLNRRLVLEAPDRSEDGAGGFTDTWQPLGTLWADLTPRRGRVATGETGALSVAGFQILVRGAPLGSPQRPLPGQRFAMAERRFRIEAVTEAEPRGLYLMCECEEEIAP